MISAAVLGGFVLLIVLPLWLPLYRGEGLASAVRFMLWMWLIDAAVVAFVVVLALLMRYAP